MYINCVIVFNVVVIIVSWEVVFLVCDRGRVWIEEGWMWMLCGYVRVLGLYVYSVWWGCYVIWVIFVDDWFLWLVVFGYLVMRLILMMLWYFIILFFWFVDGVLVKDLILICFDFFFCFYFYIDIEVSEFFFFILWWVCFLFVLSVYGLFFLFSGCLKIF